MIVSVLIGQLNAIVFNFAQPASHVEYHTTLTGIVVPTIYSKIPINRGSRGKAIWPGKSGYNLHGLTCKACFWR